MQLKMLDVMSQIDHPTRFIINFLLNRECFLCVIKELSRKVDVKTFNAFNTVINEYFMYTCDHEPSSNFIVKSLLIAKFS